MHEDEVGAVKVLQPEGCVGKVVAGIEPQVEIGVELGELVEGALALGLFAQVLDGPLVFRLPAGDLMAEKPKVVEQAAEEVGVPIVPVRAQRVGEIGDAKLTRHT